MRSYKLCLIITVAILTVASAAGAQFMAAEPAVSSRSVLSVDQLRPGDEFELAVEAVVREGHHIGSHDEDAEYPASLTVEAPDGITFDDPVFPRGERKTYGTGEKIPVHEGTFVVRVKGRVADDAALGSVTITSKLETQACAGEICFPPEFTESGAEVEIVALGSPVKQVNTHLFAAASFAAAGAESAPVARDDANKMRDKLAGVNVAVRLAMIFGLGLLIAFTPCVYPMYPVTVGYFTGQTDRKTKKVLLLAGIYVLGLALTYAVLGAVASMPGRQFGAAMESPYVLMGIAAVLVGLALSMFGLYELRPPAFMLNRASGKSGAWGALIMGAIFGIVAAPCVGPVVLGLLLYVAQTGSPLTGFLLFFVLALGIGTPLFFVAAFSGKMPVPGMWMVAVKKVAGFLLIGAAAYFILPLVPPSMGRFLIPAVLLAGGIYLGFFEKSITSSRPASSVGKVLAASALILAVILGAPRADRPSLQWQPYEPAGIQAAAEAGYPSMLDFTAEWCAACKELEHGPFSDPEVIAAADRFKRFRVDGTHRGDKAVQEAVKKFRVRGFPTVIFFDSSGKEVKPARITGYVDSEAVLKRINAVISTPR